MSKTVCPVCGCELSATIMGISDPFADEVLVICPACKEKDITPFGCYYRFEIQTGKTWSEVAQTAKKEYAEKRASLIDKKFVEIDDGIGGGVWVDKEKVDGKVDNI